MHYVLYRGTAHCRTENIVTAQSPQARFKKIKTLHSIGSDNSCLYKIILLEHHLLHGATSPSGPGPPHYRRFTITFRHNAIGRTPLDKWSARRGELWQHTTITIDIHAPGGIRTCNPRERAAADPRLRPRGSASIIYKWQKKVFIIEFACNTYLMLLYQLQTFRKTPSSRMLASPCSRLGKHQRFRRICHYIFFLRPWR